MEENNLQNNMENKELKNTEKLSKGEKNINSINKELGEEIQNDENISSLN